ncbi:MAG: hypothetical protein A2133_06655 [Actinobacteria bacterium RBG_16_64_13]|nr:MAG: hypothetical protein A2133_06655 [Actinobacteria bacterium RBG_16_64_13]
MPGFRPRFFVAPIASGADLRGAEVPLSAEDSHHARRVLRLDVGDECEVVVGAAVYAATVGRLDDPVWVRVVSRLEGSAAGAAYKTQVGLVQSLARSNVTDWVLEKGTEVGVSFFLLLKAAGSPKRAEWARDDRLDRWRRIVREAAKQSKQVEVPEVEVSDSIEDVFRRLEASGATSILLEPQATMGLREALEHRPPSGPIALWVGPEGGWTSAEADQFSAAGVDTARLGRGVLRTETAGPVAVAVARLVLGDW